MFDFGFWEISIIAIITLIVVGPDKMPALARKAGLYAGKFNKFVRKIKTDINDELREYDFSYSLTTTTKIWRWTITFISLNFFIQSLQNLNCFSFINSDACAIWLQPSSNLYIIIKNLFNFFFGANFTQPISKFLGLFSLLIYILGLIQWSIIKLPKNGRNSCFSENGRN